MTTDTPRHSAGPPEPGRDVKSAPMPELEEELDYSPAGLSQAEAAKRLTQYGPNEIAEHKTSPLFKFLGCFWGPIPWMIEVTVILSGGLRHWPDFFIILLLLVANGVVGCTSERQAGNAVDALKAKLAMNARAIRAGASVTAPARERVPGDVIRPRLGDIVPADIRLLDGDEIEVDQSALTGESLPATSRPVLSMIEDLGSVNHGRNRQVHCDPGTRKRSSRRSARQRHRSAVDTARTTSRNRRVCDQFPFDGAEVTDKLFESPASIAVRPGRGSPAHHQSRDDPGVRCVTRGVDADRDRPGG
ncbi:cation-transporting P-type ATPase [Candidatus Mycobacterium methanotrophicum]|uniref:Cation-transporting P-type ATPase n=1 Tax=Candidatus Mycobacterium methanotrophicum TaxID=2943498 RepID=A0ABY4QNH9_9MYCO|nr:cation-transporting P-type ATPase [Candidatus Mycobacterium methanotrophicum]UQX12560.1 cation-transporting P-type ATPase [Candidatus Mycobacterium methanotrophicum]